MSTEKRKQGRPVGTRLERPQNEARVRKVLSDYEATGNFAEVGRRNQMSRMGASLLYKRWKDKV